MAKTITSDLLAKLGLDSTNLALCWKITKKNGDIIRGTDHDLDVVIGSGTFAGTYVAGANITGSDVASSDDMSVDNLEVNGAISDNIAIPDLTAADIAANLLDNAAVVMFFCDWTDPDLGQVYMRSGWLGDLTLDSNNVYKTELRGLSQLLSQNIVQSYSTRCNVIRFGDARCKLDVDTLFGVTATVTSVTNRKVFAIDSIASPPGQFNGGLLIGVTGANAGFTRQIKDDDTGATYGNITLYEAFPENVSPGDTFRATPGCDRTLSTCRDVYDNLVNFRGYGVFIPGIDAMLKGPVGSSSSSSSGGSGGGI